MQKKNTELGRDEREAVEGDGDSKKSLPLPHLPLPKKKKRSSRNEETQRTTRKRNNYGEEKIKAARRGVKVGGAWQEGRHNMEAVGAHCVHGHQCEMQRERDTDRKSGMAGTRTRRPARAADALGYNPPPSSSLPFFPLFRPFSPCISSRFTQRSSGLIHPPLMPS